MRSKRYVVAVTLVDPSLNELSCPIAEVNRACRLESINLAVSRYSSS